DGLRRMYGDDPENVIYYLTVYNEPNVQPKEPEDVDHEGILRGMYLLARGSTEGLATTPVGCSCSPPVSVCRGPWRPRSCCARTGASSPTSGRSPRGASCAVTASRPTSRRSCTPSRRPGCPTSPSACRTR